MKRYGFCNEFLKFLFLVLCLGSTAGTMEMLFSIIVSVMSIIEAALLQVFVLEM